MWLLCILGHFLEEIAKATVHFFKLLDVRGVGKVGSGASPTVMHVLVVMEDGLACERRGLDHLPGLVDGVLGFIARWEEGNGLLQFLEIVGDNHSRVNRSDSGEEGVLLIPSKSDDLAAPAHCEHKNSIMSASNVLAREGHSQP